MTYDPRQHTDPLFPGGRPACTRCNSAPVYLAGLCGACYAAGYDKECSVGLGLTDHCATHDSAWDLNRKRCQAALGLVEPATRS